MNPEQERLLNMEWKHWGPYLTERQWGTVREDYSPDGIAWNYTTHDMARSKAWRWGEEGIGGICDKDQLLCFALSFWNKKDPILKERLFGLTGYEGNHGEDVKEIYYYLDSTPTHSYMKMLYKYPQAAYPYEELIAENKRRTRLDPEYELIDTGILDSNQYFDIFIEYAKADPSDLLIKITIENRADTPASIDLLPTIWFRNEWSWEINVEKPELFAIDDNLIEILPKKLDPYWLYCDPCSELLFCENETNRNRLYQFNDGKKFPKDGIHDYIIHKTESINPDRSGTKASAHYPLTIGAGGSTSIRLRLTNKGHHLQAFADFENIFNQRKAEADQFYSELQENIPDEDARLVQRQAFAGMLWSKQFYYYDVQEWLKGDPGQPPPPAERLAGRNAGWTHLKNAEVISMPDKWEYPWYASWDLAFHCITFAIIDAEFAKQQLQFLTHEWTMHPSGQLPAYEWSFSDTNPPVHAWAAWRIYEIDKHNNQEKGDMVFLETIFHKLIINFTWWVNRKDTEGNNIFEGGFLGMDNIGVFDRNEKLPNGSVLEQSDGTSWMAMYSLNLMRIALELAKENPVYQEMATKFFDHFMYIAGAMDNMVNGQGLWDIEDEFFYDAFRISGKGTVQLKTRSMVGLIPLFAVEVLDDDLLQSQPLFAARLNWFLEKQPDLANLVSRWGVKGVNEKHLLSLLRGHRMKRILSRMLDENEFLGSHGIRALSKFHEANPFSLEIEGHVLNVQYTPGESRSAMFGGNSNWRGPIWIQMNFLIIEALQRFHHYYGDDFKVEYPTHSGQYLSLNEIGNELIKKITGIFLKGEDGKRPVFGEYQKFQVDPHFSNYIWFFEYIHGDTGRGVGASHQTGWTGLVAKLIHPR
ncbi:MAG: glucosidase [Chitinophagales bacterium]